jgi:hypothetical protein
VRRPIPAHRWLGVFGAIDQAKPDETRQAIPILHPMANRSNTGRGNRLRIELVQAAEEEGSIMLMMSASMVLLSSNCNCVDTDECLFVAIFGGVGLVILLACTWGRDFVHWWRSRR